jgi:hypothetical protein
MSSRVVDMAEYYYSNVVEYLPRIKKQLDKSLVEQEQWSGHELGRVVAIKTRLEHVEQVLLKYIHVVCKKRWHLEYGRRANQENVGKERSWQNRAPGVFTYMERSKERKHIRYIKDRYKSRKIQDMILKRRHAPALTRGEHMHIIRVFRKRGHHQSLQNMADMYAESIKGNESDPCINNNNGHGSEYESETLASLAKVDRKPIRGLPSTSAFSTVTNSAMSKAKAQLAGVRSLIEKCKSEIAFHTVSADMSHLKREVDARYTDSLAGQFDYIELHKNRDAYINRKKRLDNELVADTARARRTRDTDPTDVSLPSTSPVTDRDGHLSRIQHVHVRRRESSDRSSRSRL